MAFQIQSVAARRATQEAVHSIRLNEPTILLDYTPNSTPQLPPPPPAPPLLQCLVDGLALPISSSQGSAHLPAILSVHRLCVSGDGEGEGEVPMWRLSVLQQETARMSLSYASERTVLQFITAATAPTSLDYASQEHLWTSSAPVSVLWLTGEIPSDVSICALRGGTDDASTDMLGVKIVVGVPSMGAVLERRLPLTTVKALLRLPGTRGSELFTSARLESHCQQLAGLLQFKEHSAETDSASDNDTLGPLPKALVLEGEWRHMAGEMLQEGPATTVAMELVQELCVIETDGSLQIISRAQGAIHFEPGEADADAFAWEVKSDNVMSLSLRASGGIDRLSQVPGASPIGRALQSFNAAADDDGEGFSRIVQKDRSVASAIFFRDNQISSTDSILVNATLAWDSPCKHDISYDTYVLVKINNRNGFLQVWLTR